MTRTGASGTARDPASWRDPSGFVFRRDGRLLRQIAPAFSEEWEAFERSGLRARLVERGMLVGSDDAPLEEAADPSAWRVIAPEPIDFISYPYEWTFGELRDAALLTLDAQAEALAAGMTLRDASAYNVQFRGAVPVLIDSLSFERRAEDEPWVAYRQFCEHFLAPLALMSRRDVRLGRMLRDWIDGIPLDLAAALLPGRTKLGLGLGAHVHLHARAQRRHGDAGSAAKQVRVSLERLGALVASLRSTVAGLRYEPSGTTWADYADHTSYDDAATAEKARAVEGMLRAAGGSVVWDLGANTGRYSRIADELGRRVLAFDLDAAAAERHYRELRSSGRTQRVTPLVMDLADPSPGLGWANRERASLADRGGADTLLALALVHHVAIGHNVPLPMIADWLADLGSALVIEWVPREDAMVGRLLAARRDIFEGYTEEAFTAALHRRWEVVERVPIAGTVRVLYRARRR